MMKYTYLLIACTAIALSACGEKKSLDGHSMEKPPPSAFIERDSAPDFDEPGETTDNTSSSEEKN